MINTVFYYSNSIDNDAYVIKITIVARTVNGKSKPKSRANKSKALEPHSLRKNVLCTSHDKISYRVRLSVNNAIARYVELELSPRSIGVRHSPNVANFNLFFRLFHYYLCTTELTYCIITYEKGYLPLKDQIIFSQH